jgi:hypothetical protein
MRREGRAVALPGAGDVEVEAEVEAVVVAAGALPAGRHPPGWEKVMKLRWRIVREAAHQGAATKEEVPKRSTHLHLLFLRKFQ